MDADPGVLHQKMSQYQRDDLFKREQLKKI